MRELENIIAKAVLLESGPTLTVSSARELVPHQDPPREREESLMSLEELEKRHILHVLETTGQNRTKAAKILGIGLRTLQRKLKAFGTPSPTPE